MGNRIFNSLRFRLITFVIGISSLMLALLLSNSYYTVRSAHAERLQQTAQSLIKQFTRTIAPVIIESDLPTLKEHALSILEHPELTHLLVIGPGNKQLVSYYKPNKEDFHSDSKNVQQLKEVIIEEYPAFVEKNDLTVDQVDDGLFDISKEISGGGMHYGQVLMRFSLEHMDQDIRSSLILSSVILLLGMIITIIMSIAISIKLTQNLTNLAKAAIQVGAGQFNITLPPNHFDEVGLVTNAFKTMLNNIEKSTRQLRVSEASLSTTLYSIGDGMLVTDTEGRITRINDMAEKLTGWSAKDAIGLPVEEIFQIINTTSRKIVENPAREVLRTQKIVGLANHTSLISRSGEERHISDSSAPIIDDTGKFTGVILVFSDITESYLRIAKLRKSEQQYRDIFESSGDGIMVMDHDTNLLDINPYALKRLGYSKNELLGKNSFSLLVDDADGDDIKLSHHIKNRNTDSLRIKLTTKQKNKIDIETRGIAFTYADKPAFLVFFNDITERKKNETQLKLYAHVFENTHDGIAVADRNFNILTVNTAFTKITGYSADEAIGYTYKGSRSQHPENKPFTVIKEQIDATGFWQGEFWTQRKDGEKYPIWQTINSVLYEGEVQHYISIFSDISTLKKAEKELSILAHYDPLTKLPNRLLLRTRLTHAIEQAHRHHHKLAVLFLDLDRFKKVNDSLGHPAGDQLLIQIAERLSPRIREGDTLARVGGDEFIIVLDQLTQPSDAASAAQDIIETLTDSFKLLDTHDIFLGVSIGIALYPDDGKEAYELVKYADTAMYQAKKSGRNTYHFYTKQLSITANHRLTLESKLRKAIDNKELSIVFQSQVDINGDIIGAEALARWQPQQSAEISPLEFIPIAEETGLIVPLGINILELVCEQAPCWPKNSKKQPKFAINLSPRQFIQKDLIESFDKIFEKTGFDPKQLEIEITESALMQKGKESVIIINALRSRGMSIAIDDFGTGYSSLAYLKYFAIDKLKIDQSFVKELPHNKNDAEITSTIISMGRNLNLKVLAEGVETSTQLDFLIASGCQYFQGYYFAKPMKADELFQTKNPNLPTST